MVGDFKAEYKSTRDPRKGEKGEEVLRGLLMYEVDRDCRRWEHILLRIQNVEKRKRFTLYAAKRIFWVKLFFFFRFMEDKLLVSIFFLTR